MAPNSDGASMAGQTSGSRLRFIHHCISSGREVVGNLWNMIYTMGWAEKKVDVHLQVHSRFRGAPILTVTLAK
jgi:hypothetical protein